jgi:hypothetical protein
MEEPEDLLTEELPESYKELIDNEIDLNIVKENAWKQALGGKLKSALRCIISMNGENISIIFDDIFVLFDIGHGLLYKVRFHKVTMIYIFVKALSKGKAYNRKF